MANSVTKKAVQQAPANQEADLISILQLLLRKTGTDFSGYKMSTVRRRIQKRLAESKLKSFGEYLSLIKKKNSELDLLYADLLIGVTSFFRDKEAFQFLKASLLPKIIKSKKTGDMLRIWVPGCSTGEEVYSLAMVIFEIQEEKEIKIPFQIFATDLNEKAISKARQGEYTRQEINSVTRTRVEKFFIKSGEKFRVKQHVREACLFSVHNLLSEAAFSKIDLISCCNLLIYFGMAAQKKVMSSFHFALSEGGYLLLGKSETIGTATSLFSPVHKRFKIFSRKTADRNETIHGTSAAIRAAKSLKAVSDQLKPMNLKFTQPQIGLTTAIDGILLESCVPACAIVNHNLDVLQFRGDTSPFFKLSGKASLNLLKIVRPDFSFELRMAVNSAIKTKRLVKKDDIEVNIHGKTKIFSLEVMPLKIAGEEPLLMVLFREHHVVEVIRQNAKDPKLLDKVRDKKIRKLEEELLEAKVQMQQVAAEQEAMIEELQSANEEIVSSNEELRTVNEELETSKEEIEAANEELISSNKELQKRNEEVESLNHYTSSILATIPDPMLILDKNFVIRSANEQFLKTFRLHEEDVNGFSLFKLDNGEWNITELRLLLQEISDSKTNFKRQQIGHRFDTIGEKVLMVSAKVVKQKHKAEPLTLLIIEDITEEKRIELELKNKEKEVLATQLEAQAKIDASSKSQAFLESVFINAPFPISILRGPGHRYDMINEYAKKLIGNRNVLGLTIREAFPEVESQGYVALLDNVYNTGVPYIGNESLLKFDRFGDGQMHEAYFNFVYQPLFDLDGTNVEGVLSVAVEVTEQVMARRKIEQSEAQFVALVDNIQNLAWMADATGWIYWYNKRWYEYTGTEPKDMEGWGWQSVHDPEYLPSVVERWQQSIKTGTTFEMIFPLRGADGLFRQFLTRVYPIKDENGNVIRWIGTNTDVHEQKSFADELEKAVQARTTELIEANASLQKANEQLNSFNYISSHDLQEPLRKIRTFSKLIAKEEANNLSAVGRDYFSRMDDTANRMQQLLDDLLAYSRTRTTERVFEVVDLSVLVKEVLADLDEFVKEKNAVVHVAALGKANVIPFQFKQLVQNLIGNSLKFAKADTAPIITIDAKPVKASDVFDLPLSSSVTYLQISFSDNGIGFDMQYKDKIFEVFQRLHAREEYQGTGIGLAIVKRIVENHHGLIEAHSQPGQGATFNIYLPLNQGKKEPEGMQSMKRKEYSD